MAKLNRERRLLERRLEKKAKKDARKRAAAHDSAQPGDMVPPDDHSHPAGEQTAREV